MSDTLFDMDDLNCLNCGRPLTDGERCWWCDADRPEKRHHRPNIGGSRKGAYDVAKRAPTQRDRLLAEYATHTDLTGAEAATAAGINLASAYWMRCSELRRDGLIEMVLDEKGVEVQRVGPMGSPQMVCRITADGLQAVRPMKEPHDRNVDDPARPGPVPPTPDGSARPICSECGTRTCSRRPGWPYCYGGHR